MYSEVDYFLILKEIHIFTARTELRKTVLSGSWSYESVNYAIKLLCLVTDGLFQVKVYYMLQQPSRDVEKLHLSDQLEFDTVSNFQKRQLADCKQVRKDQNYHNASKTIKDYCQVCWIRLLQFFLWQ